MMPRIFSDAAPGPRGDLRLAVHELLDAQGAHHLERDLLRREVVIEARLPDAEDVGDVLRRGAVIAALGEDARRRLDDLRRAPARTPGGAARGARPPSSCRRDDFGRPRLGVEPLDQRGAALEHGALVDVALVGDLAGVDDGGSREHERRAARIELPASAASARASGDPRAHSRTTRRTSGRVAARRREAAPPRGLRKTRRADARRDRARRSPRPARAGRRRRSAARAARRRCTHVPVVSLKSSATRPSKTRPRAGLGRVGELHRVADPVEALLVEGGAA